MIHHSHCSHEPTASGRRTCRELIRKVEALGFIVEQVGKLDTHLYADDYDTYYNTFISPYDAALAADKIYQAKVDHAEVTLSSLPSDDEELTKEQAYRKGWDASRRSTTFDLGAAEDRFHDRWGYDHSSAFSNGWIDYASDYEYGHSLN